MVYLVRYSEIGLKSEPVRRRFLSLLRDRIEETHLFSAAWGGAELALVSFDLESLDVAERRLL